MPAIGALFADADFRLNEAGKLKISAFLAAAALDFSKEKDPAPLIAEEHSFISVIVALNLKNEKKLFT